MLVKEKYGENHVTKMKLKTKLKQINSEQTKLLMGNKEDLEKKLKEIE